MVAPASMPSSLVPSVAMSLPSTVPVTDIFPETDSFSLGFVRPIPTLPLEGI